MDSLITTASSTLATNFGFDIFSASITFMKTWALFILGAGLGVLQSLMPYIVGIVVISAIVYFLYRMSRGESDCIRCMVYCYPSICRDGCLGRLSYVWIDYLIGLIEEFESVMS